MKKIVALIISMSLLITGCSFDKFAETNSSSESSSVAGMTEVLTTDAVDVIDPEVEFINSLGDLGDPELLGYLEDRIYLDLVSEMQTDDYCIESVSAIYLSQEYLEEAAYNSLENIYFGYTLSEVNEMFQGNKFVFTLDDNGETTVVEYPEYDDTYGEVIRNVAIGAGVILICVTISVVAGPAGAPAVAAIFSCAAQNAAIVAVSSGVITGCLTGIVSGAQSGDWDQAFRDGLLAGSESFKVGAIMGAVTGGGMEALSLYRGTASGLTMNEVAQIQRNSQYPIELISQFRNMEEYELYSSLGLRNTTIGGRMALIRDIDLDYVSPNTELNPNGLSNLQLMQRGNAPISPEGTRYELHHIGQNMDSPLAILTESEHDLPGLHLAEESRIDRTVWNTQRSNFWKNFANYMLSLI